MARAGLTIGNPALLGLETNIDSSNYALPAMDFTGLARGENAITSALAGMAAQTETELKVPKKNPSVFYNSGSKQYAVGDIPFDEDDYAAFVELEPYVGRTTTKPAGGGWEPVDEAGFREYVGKIKNPTAMDLFGRGVDIGTASGKQLLGSLAQFAGAEGMGGRIAASATRELEKLQPFQRDFTDIQSAEDFGAFVASNLGQQVPNLLASILTGGAGYAIGGATALGRTSAARYLGSKLMTTEGREVFMKNLQSGTAKQLAKEKLTDAERDALIQAGRAGGAAIGVTLQNYLTGVADIYKESQESGVDMDDTTARLASVLGGTLYAALDTIPELGYVKSFLNSTGKQAYKTLSKKGAALEFGKRAGVGALKGATTEGITEGLQESLLLGITGQPLGSEENLNRLTNAIAAGAVVGTTLGGISNLSGPKNLLATRETPAAPAVPTTPAGLMGPAPTEQLELFPEGALPEMRRPGMVGEQLDIFGAEDMQGGFTPSTQQLDLFATAAPVTPTPASRGPQLDLFADYVPPVPPPPPPPPSMGLVPTGAPRVNEPTATRIPGLALGYTQPTLPAPAAAPVSSMQVVGTPDFVVGPTGARTAEAGDVLLGVQGNVPPGPQAGSQGLLDIFGGQPVTAEELASRMVPSTAIPMGTPPVEQVRNPQQGALQFAPAAPESWGRAGNTQLAKGLGRLAVRRQGEQGFTEQEAARQAVQQAQREADYQEALNQRELQRADELAAQARAQADAYEEAARQARLAAERQQEEAAAQLKEKQKKANKLQRQLSKKQRKAETAARMGKAPQQTAAPTKEEVKGAKLKRGKSQEQTSKREGTESGGRLASKREDRVQPTKVQETSGAPSGGRSVKRGTTAQEEVRPATKPAAKLKPAAKAAPEAKTSPRVSALVRDGEMIKAGKQWGEYSDVAWNTLTPAQQERWRKAVIEDGNPTIALAEEIAPAPKAAPVAPTGAMGFVTKPKPAGKTKLATAREATAAKKAEVVIDSNEPVVPATAVTTPVSGYELVTQTLEEAKSAKEEKKATEAQIRYAADLVERMGKKTVDFKPREAVPQTSFEQKVRKFIAHYNANLQLMADAKNGKADWYIAAAQAGILDQLNLTKTKNLPVTYMGVGRNKRVSDNADATPIGIGRVKMLVNQFVAKLRVKPTVNVYADINDLKLQNPELYRRAKAARVEGDFDNTLASGYSFGKDIIIFSNNIFSADHLNFVMAHETLGHFGMRSIMAGKDFDALMNKVYESSGGIRNAVDAAMASSNMSRSEAVEEYLSDFAGTLSNSLLARVWAAIKNALNKLGVKFSDDMARYLINQSRRYVYEGKTGNTFINSAVALRVASVESGEGAVELGRYSGKPNLRDDNQQAALMANYTSDTQGMSYDQLSDFLQRAKAAGMDFNNNFDTFKEKFFSLLNFRTRENPGLSALHDVLSAGRDLAMSIRVLMNERMAVVLNRAIERLPSLGGITQAHLDQVNRMLYEGQRYAISKYKSSLMKNTPLYYVDDKGEVKINPNEAKRIQDMGTLKFEQMRDGFSYNVTYLKEGVEVTERINVDGIPDLTEDSDIWRGYEATRASMADVELKLLQARYVSFLQESKDAFRSIAKAMQGGTLTAADNAFLEKVYKGYKDIWQSNPIVDKDGDETPSEESMTKANEFLAKMNELIIAKESDKNVKLKDVLADTALKGQYDDLIASLEEFKKRFGRTKETEYVIQNKLKEVLMAELSNLGGDKYTKTTLATGYLPLLRTGDYQVRIVAYDEGGNPVRLKSEYKDQLSYTQHEKESDALETADLINKQIFGDRKYTVEVFDENAGQYKAKEVTLRAESGVVLSTVAAPPSLNLNEFIHGLRRFNVVLTPSKMEQVILALTKQDNKARKRLQRSFVPGADMDGVTAVSQHIDSRASTISKVMMRPQLNRIMDRSLPSTMALWKADERVDGVPKLKYLKDVWDKLSQSPDATPEEVTAAKRAYYEYKYMNDKTNPEGRASRENMYYNEASRLLTFLDSNKSLDESDFGAGKVVSSIRAWTSLAQLGGSLATGALNYIGLFTNSFPYLATFNERTAFGEGFGFGNAVTAFFDASENVGLARAIGNSKFNTSIFYDEIAKNAELQEQYGLTAAEAAFMAQEIREGVMIPAQSNALANTARGRITSGAWQKLMDGWMWTFNSTEQAARRSLGLATFRLAYQRNIAAKMSEQQAIDAARKSAVDAIRYTMGEYSVINRPPAWRSGLQSFLYMYKVYPTTTIQTLSRLSREGQRQMLVGLWLLSGLAGMPFAEDFEDLLDTIAQKLGLTMSSVRFELAKFLDSVVPGVSPYLLRGVVNSLFPADIASRVSAGDFIPGTEILLAGSDIGQQVKEILGPSASAITGAASTMMSALSAATTEKTSIADVFRESPVTMMRAMGDAYVYAQTGTVIDKKGYVVTPDVSMMTILARMGGFYPASASEAYETIKLTNRITDYQREVSGAFKRAWVKSMIANDTDRARRIEAEVREWNLAAEGTGLEIRDFRENAKRALKEAERPAKERSLRAVGKATQATIEELDTLLSYPTSQL